MRLFVIMANDFPEGVMDDETKAKALVEARNDADKTRRQIGHSHWGSAPIYWNVYPFTLNELEQ